MTELFIVVATALAALFMADPFFGGQLTKAPIAKEVVLILGFGTVLFHLIGRSVTAPERLRKVVGGMLADWWPLLVLSLLILAGSAYARYAGGVTENFLAMGLGMLFLPLFAVAVASAQNPLLLMKGLAAVYALMVLGMLAVLLSGGHLFHEEVFVAVPLGVYFLCQRRPSIWRLLFGFALIGAFLYSVKNTTFLLVLITLALCIFIWGLQSLRSRTGLTVIVGVYVGVILLTAAVVGLYAIWLEYRSTLPSGNVEYRTEMYGIAWRRFLDSPGWGTAFADSSVSRFTLYLVGTSTQYLPTHSDVLDLLSHGGAVAIALWLGFVWRVLVIGRDCARKLVAAPADEDVRPWRWLCVLVVLQICAAATYSVNPPLISPVHAFWIWGSAGVMWALHRILTMPQHASAPASSASSHRAFA